MGKIKEIILNMFFPSRCCVCGRVCNFGKSICTECLCERNDSIVYNNSEYGKMHFDGLVSVFFYRNDVKKAIWDFKFRKNTETGKKLSECLAKEIQINYNIIDFDLVVPVPKYGKADFNESEEICRCISQAINIKCNCDCLLKIKNTEFQHDLDKLQREQNLIGAFKVNCADAVAQKTVLLVDDIITTGSTLDNCAKALKQAGASYVYAATIARSAKK